MFKKLIALLFAVTVLSLMGLVVLFHTPYQNWQNIHPNLVYKLKDKHKESWYPLAARVLNLPIDGKIPYKPSSQTADKKDNPAAERVMPAKSFLVGAVELKLLEGGFYYLPAFKKYSPGGRIQFHNRDDKKKLETLFDVEIIDPVGKTIFYRTRKFVNIGPGKSLNVMFGNREEILFEKPGNVPGLAFRISLPNGYTKNLDIPKRLLRPAQ